MRKAIIILSILALIASSCGQATKKQTETEIETENNVANVSIQQYGGIYAFGDKNSETANGTVYIYPETDSTALFYLFKMRGAPSYNMGSIDGQIVIQDRKAIFRKSYDDLENDCVLRFEFRNDTLIVEEDENDCDCSPEFGYGVHINNTFLRISSETPQYYTNITNEEIYFSEWKDEYEQTNEVEESNETLGTYRGYKHGEEEGWYKVIYDKENITSNDSIYTSNIRPNEKLYVGDIYTDNFKYFDYSDDGDDLLLMVLKDNKIYTFVANEFWETIHSELNDGDLLEIQWKIDFMTPAGDNSIYFVIKDVEKITKIDNE